MPAPRAFVDCLLAEGIEFFTGVPDSLLKDFCLYIDEHLAPGSHVITANEGNAVALAAGRFLGTGRAAAVYMQNSGLGNAVNPLTSLADAEVYGVPMLLVIGWRGEPGVKDEPQHLKQGRVTPAILDALEIPYWVVGGDSAVETLVSEACARMRHSSAPVALLIRKGTFDAHHGTAPLPAPYELRREDAVQLIADALDEDVRVISTTGHASRELYEHRRARDQDGATDFLTVGSMGHAASIALGLALARPERHVVCLDGDGSLLMHMGMLAVIGSLAPANLIHIVLNNGAHESVGGQPTAGFLVNFPGFAKAAGYGRALCAETAGELENALAQLLAGAGPGLLEVRVRQGARADLGRPTTTPIANRDAFMAALGVQST
jgi:phosphonopyruvate decarboxylase